MVHRSQMAAVAALGALLVAAGLARAPLAAPRADPRATALAEFLEWAHPAEGGCAPVDGIQVVARWPGGLRAAYVVPCAGERRRLEAVLETREAPSVWQVAAGFEADADAVAAAIAARDLAIPGASGEGGVAPGAVEPPPGNAGASGDDGQEGSPLRALSAPAPRQRARPEL